MNRSEAVNELALALAKAQIRLKNPAFDSNNPHFKSKYASLAAVRDAVVPVLASEGISVTQWPDTTQKDRVTVETVLLHASGQWLSGSCSMPIAQPTAQGVGSALTYARRYGLMAATGVVGDDDDDANAASTKASTPVEKPVASVDELKKMVRSTLSGQDVKARIRGLLEEAGVPPKEQGDLVVEATGKPKGSQLDDADVAKVRLAIKQRPLISSATQEEAQ